jgi:enediyne biosynthesis protein E4
LLASRAFLFVCGACAVGLVAAVLAAARPSPTLGPQLACADVARSVGLEFTGDYGPVLPAPDAYGTLMQENMGNGAAVGDYDGDGYLDVLLLGQAGHQTKLFRNDPTPDGGRRFTDVTDAAGLRGVTSNARVAQFVDLSGSGRPDLVIAADYMPDGPAGPSQILRNNGDGTFTDVTAGSGFDPVGYIVGGMTFADYDGTGRQSIYVSFWTEELAGDPGRPVVKGAFPGQNRLYQNLGDYRFKDVTYSSGIGEYHADSFTAVFADFNDDSLPDLYQANDHRPDRFFQNLGGGRFRDSSDAAELTRAGNSMGVATTVGPDGGLQLYVTHITDPSGLYGSNLGNTFMVSEQDSNGIRFRNVAAQYGILDTAWGWGTSFVDMNLDGAPDLYAVQGMRAYVGNGSAHLANATSTMFLSDATGSRFDVAKGTGCDVPGDQRALVVFDYNRDGSPDLLITQVAGPTVLLQNYTGGKHWLTVVPEGSDDAGLGARVTVTAGGRTTTQILLAGGSYLAGPPREVYFGLDAAPIADVVRIDWADGTTTELPNVKADQILRVSPRSS